MNAVEQAMKTLEAEGYKVKKAAGVEVVKGDFKGNPTLSMKGDFKPVTFGLKKWRTIVANIDLIKSHLA